MSSKVCLWYIGAICILFGCKSQQILVREKLPHKGRNFLINKLDNAPFKFDNLSWKASVDITQNEKENSFKINGRQINDSAIWLSITPALGIEAARVLLTSDSVKFINKLDKQYFVGTYAYLSEKFGVDLNFQLIQNALAGRAVMFDAKEKYKAFTEKEYYFLQAKSSKKLTRLSGLRKEDWVPVDSIDLKNAKEKRMQKALEKLPEEATVLTRYWLEPSNFYLVKQGIYDFENSKQLEINFSEFDNELMKGMPQKIRIMASSKEQRIDAIFKITKVKSKEELTLPFTISEKYEPMD